MIDFLYQTDFKLSSETTYTSWITRVIQSENKTAGAIKYYFTDDETLADINKSFLNHDEYTDVISFDKSDSDEISGDVFISVDRVTENAATYKEPFETELKRVMIHGILHFMGLKDDTDLNKEIMRASEEAKIDLFHVEQ